MWTRPTRPPSSWMNAPSGVIRCTVPSTTAPTSRSAMPSSSRLWSEPSPARCGELSHRDHAPSICRNRAVRTGPRPSAARRLRVAVLGHDGERDLARHHHPDALSGQALQVGRVVEELDPGLEPPVALLQDLGLPGELGDL